MIDDDGKISVVMPFWQRQEVLRINLGRFRQLYPKENLEIIIVDDGSPVPARVQDEMPWPVQIIRLPAKDCALNPCSVFNQGVRASSGELILLTNPEVVHQTKLLRAMARTLAYYGPRSYLAAACWQSVRGRWLCHSKHRYKEIGKMRAGLHFCAMLPRAIYNEVGGFSEEYRDGQGCEDVDFLYKLAAAGVHCEIEDSFVTQDLRTIRCAWPVGGLQRNREIFEAKWGKTEAAALEMPKRMR